MIRDRDRGGASSLSELLVGVVFPASGWTAASRSNPSGKYVEWRLPILAMIE
jgi:hypothetical protein